MLLKSTVFLFLFFLKSTYFCDGFTEPYPCFNFSLIISDALSGVNLIPPGMFDAPGIQKKKIVICEKCLSQLEKHFLLQSYFKHSGAFM